MHVTAVLIFRFQLEGWTSGEERGLMKRDVEDRSCYEPISSDPDIKGAIAKICTHLETNSRQSQVCIYMHVHVGAV